VLLNIYIVFSATYPATNLVKTVAKPSYRLIEYLHGMQGVRGSNPLGSIAFYLVIAIDSGDSHKSND